MIQSIKAATLESLGRTMARRAVTVLPGDTFLVSYPRSGNTWVRFLIGNLLQPAHPITFANIEQVVPDIYQNSDRALRALAPPRVLKSHEYFDPRYQRVIYLVRDPRDVAVSYYHYHIKISRFDETYPIDRFVYRFVTGDLDRYGSWGEHVGSWLGARQDTETFLLLAYENLLERLEEGLRRLARFLGIEVDDFRLGQVMELSSAVNMRQLERREADVWRPTQQSRKDRPFVRLARAGGWHTELPVESVRLIEGAWQAKMEMLGYPVSRLDMASAECGVDDAAA